MYKEPLISEHREQQVRELIKSMYYVRCLGVGGSVVQCVFPSLHRAATETSRTSQPKVLLVQGENCLRTYSVILYRDY